MDLTSRISASSEIAMDTYYPRRRLIELKSARRHHTFNGKHEWRRQETGKKRSQKTKPESDSSLTSLEYLALSSFFDFEEYMDIYGFESPDKSFNLSTHRSRASKVLRMYDAFPKALKLLADKKVYTKISEEYTLQEALFIQKRLDMEEGLKLHEMIDYGRFIIDNKSCKLYFVDMDIEALLGIVRLTPEEFFKADAKGVFKHYKSRNGAFVYVTLQKEDLPLPQVTINYNTETRKRFPRIDHAYEQDILQGRYRDDPFESAVFGDRISRLVESKLKY